MCFICLPNKANPNDECATKKLQMSNFLEELPRNQLFLFGGPANHRCR